MNKFWRQLNNVVCLIIVIVTISLIGFVAVSLLTMDNPQVSEIKNPSYTSIYSDDDNIIEIIGKDKKQFAEYEDIPKPLVYALVSIEDSTFFKHEGIDYRRTFQAFLHNLASNNRHGGSTITQQLVKNLYLSDDQTYKRKIQEAFLAYKLESILTKEEIITQYFNYVYFEPTIPGVVYASRYYFNKELKELTLPEMATLAGLVKSASFYHPIKYPERANSRKNLVLKAMMEQNYITTEQYNVGITQHVNTFLNIGQKSSQTFQFQAYLDVVYLEIKELLNIDIFTHKLEIHTYLDSSLQDYLDRIQSGQVVDFLDEDQQLGACILRNDDAAITGVIGGRDYKGSRLFSHAYSLKRQPASTIKPVLGYLLAAEHLHYNGATSIKDEPYTYPGSNFTVQNADKTYAGYLSVEEALGYSKNTSALYTLENVANDIGNQAIIDYLNSVNLMDNGPFTYAYGIGGYSYGISPVQLAGAYRMLSAEGNYLKPSTIKYVKDATTGKVLYQRNEHNEQIVSKESAFIIADTLRSVVKKNYYNIGILAIEGQSIGGKTGTNGYDGDLARKLGYPASADKDSWIAGFSQDYTITIWTGFDVAEPGKDTYFGKGDARRKIPKTLFGQILKRITVPHEISAPLSLVQIGVVKHANDYYLPNRYIPESYIIAGYFWPNEIPTHILPEPTFPNLANAKVIAFDQEIIIDFEIEQIMEEPFDYAQLFGQRAFLLSYEKDGQIIEQVFPTNHIILNENIDQIHHLSVAACFTNNTKIASTIYELTL